MKYFFKIFQFILSVVLSICFIIGICILLSNIFSSGYNFYQAHKPPKYDPEKYMIINEANSNKSFILDLIKLQAIDINNKNESELNSIAVALDVSTADYNRLYAGGFAPQELKEFCINVKFQLHSEEEIEWGHKVKEPNDNVVEHYHIKNRKVTKPSKKCEKCQSHTNHYKATIALN